MISCCFHVQISVSFQVRFGNPPFFPVHCVSWIQRHEEWYNGLTTASSFEEVQEFLWQEDINDDCPRPCEPLCSSKGNCSAMGVNVFGFDGFSDEASVKRAVQKLFQQGVRHFRVVNVGAWADAALTAINEAAGIYPGASSVKITSLFFDSASSLDRIGHHWHIFVAHCIAFHVPTRLRHYNTASTCLYRICRKDMEGPCPTHRVPVRNYELKYIYIYIHSYI